jgi:hypothetical protein
MAGRKNHLQGMGVMGKDLGQIKDPFERDFAFRAMQTTPYCRHCGREILLGGDPGKDNVSKFQRETKMMSHGECQNLWEEKERTRIAMEAKEKAKAFAELDMDKYLEQLVKQRDE